MSKEEWRPVVGYEGRYEVSNLGNVRSLTRKTRSRTFYGEPKSPWSSGNNDYLKVSLYKESKGENLLVHALVAEAFIGPRRKGMDVNHKNGNKQDNRPENLEYLTRSQHIRHSIDVLGKVHAARGEQKHNAKLTEQDVREIRRLADTKTRKELAAQFGVHGSTISDIINRRKNGWRWLE